MRQRRAEAVAAELGGDVEVDAMDALVRSLWSAWGVVEFWRFQVGVLEPDEPGDSAGITRPVIGLDHLGDQAVDVAVAQYQAAIERAAKVAKLCLDAGFEERQVRLAERQAAVMAAVIGQTLQHFGVTVSSPEVSSVVRRLLLELSAGDVVADVRGDR